jgi:hypothetical protein
MRHGWLVVVSLFAASCGNQFDVPNERAISESNLAEVKGKISPIQLTLENQKYFDAKAMGEKFLDMVKIQSTDGNPISSDHYAMTVSPVIDNGTFGEDFQVYLMGEDVGQYERKTNSSGQFKFSDVPEGVFDIRVQKNYQLNIAPKALVLSDTEERTFCFTIYGEESGIEVEGGENVSKTFKNFKLFFLDKDCKGESTSGGITIQVPGESTQPDPTL